MKKILFVLLIVLLASCNTNKNIKRFRIKTDAMMKIIEYNDIVDVDTSIKEFSYGDIVMIDYYDETDSTRMGDVFRIVGMPKDSISVQDGICTLNGIKCKNSFIRDEFLTKELEEELPNGIKIRIHVYPRPKKELDQPTIYVPSNHYYVLGDMRADGIDSRYFGTITNKEIVGKVIKIEKAEKKSEWWEQ